MTATLTDPLSEAPRDFRHEALFYSGDDDFLSGTVPFLADAVSAAEPALVVLNDRKIEMLRGALGRAADQVYFADMAQVGRNPARIIPAWRDFVDRHAHTGRPLRGIGEPIWASRTPAELVECQQHEALLNVAFAESSAWWLMCPYDTKALDPTVLAEAVRSHPFVRDAAGSDESRDFRAADMSTSHRSDPLPEPARVRDSMRFSSEQLGVVRVITARRAAQFGLHNPRRSDLVLAVHEIAANSVRHGGGTGSFRLWREGRSLVCEIRDAGTIDNPLAGRVHPGASAQSGRGLWMANQLCDLVQIRSIPTGLVVRLHISLDNPATP